MTSPSSVVIRAVTEICAASGRVDHLADRRTAGQGVRPGTRPAKIGSTRCGSPSRRNAGTTGEEVIDPPPAARHPDLPRTVTDVRRDGRPPKSGPSARLGDSVPSIWVESSGRFRSCRGNPSPWRPRRSHEPVPRGKGADRRGAVHPHGVHPLGTSGARHAATAIRAPDRLPFNTSVMI